MTLSNADRRLVIDAMLERLAKLSYLVDPHEHRSIEKSKNLGILAIALLALESRAQSLGYDVPNWPHENDDVFPHGAPGDPGVVPSVYIPDESSRTGSER